MPEAPVDEHGELPPRKQNVGSQPYGSNRFPIHEIAEATSVQDPTHRQLRASIAPSVALHAGSCPGRRSPGVALVHHSTVLASLRVSP